MRKTPSVFTPINLMRNVVDALSDTPAEVIAVTAQLTNGRFVISIADNGPGTPPGQPDKIFVPFCTAKRDGSGISLTRVRVRCGPRGKRRCRTDAGMRRNQPVTPLSAEAP